MAAPLLLYGFDARVRLETDDLLWTAARRAQYLLRPDVRRPCSVDRLVWPQAPSALAADRFAPDYSSDLEALRNRCASGALIAMVVVEHDERARALWTPCVPAEIDPAWRALGWDVADTGLISGLSNCGFLPGADDLEALRSQYGPLLNEHGLFRERADAEAYRAVSDARVKEHAPFFVHQLLLIEER